MGRVTCCEKAGLKKGTWTTEEDRILVAHVQRYGHDNWRALPKQAGLLRCGKSCRFRWVNYLRPDIKRGNFSKKEEGIIINLHQMLGNRWSAIAARLPGRTDNEVKNLWHTYLKKKATNPSETIQESKETRGMAIEFDANLFSKELEYPSHVYESYSDISSSSITSSIQRDDINVTSIRDENIYSLEGSLDIVGRCFSETPSVDKGSNMWDFASASVGDPYSLKHPFNSDGYTNDDDNVSFWLKVFMGTTDL